ncbi:MAG: endo-1,4-beta-xylanase [Armatimonadetes bacterium]|nr:endo-1,4-beta-xylanase [Armatimonadota bacterium]
MRAKHITLAALPGLAATLGGGAVAAPKFTPASPVNETCDTAGLFGLNGVGFFHYRDAPDAQETARKKMDFLQQAGATWDRFDFWWSEMEPRRGVWKWDKADWLVDFYARHGVNMLPILSYRAAWMTQPPHTPEDDAEFADYVRHLVRRYKDRVHAWEVWNEPNIPTFWKPPSAPDYTAMLKAAYTAAHQEDPHCVIVGASANETDLNWIRDIARSGGLRYMDAVSIHPYSMADGPEQMGLLRQLEDVHTLLASLGRPNLPVWITEMGWTSSITDAAGNAHVGAYMTQSYVIAAAEHVPHLFWFSEQDWTEGGKLQGWGLISPDFRAKPTLAAYRRLADTLGDSTFAGYLPLRDGIGYVFQRRGARTVFAWAHRGRTLTLRVGTGARVMSANGQTIPVQHSQITLTDMPVMIQGANRVLLAGVTRALPAPDTDNLVVNGTVAEVDAHGSPYGWHRGVFYGGADKGAFAVADEGDGGHSLRLSQTTDALWESWPVPALPGEHYTLTAQVKATDATGDNGVQILFLSGPGWGWRGGPASATVIGTTDWRTATVSGIVPDDADVVRVNLVSKNNTGGVQFRRIVLTRAETTRP